MAAIQADFVVIGGGIVGAATARALQDQYRGSKVVIVEKESEPSLHQTGHNSGVIHSGILYKPGSKKAEMCMRGALRMLEFCEDSGIPFAISGKLIVAVEPHELPRLDELVRQGTANGVEGIKLLGEEELREMEPHAGGLAALHVPGAAVTDFAMVTRALLRDLEADDGQVILGFDVKHIEERVAGATLTSTEGVQIRAKQVVACAGLQSDRLARQSTTNEDLRILPFRGTYFSVREPTAAYVRSMIYPVPDPRFPFLGVHFTRHVDGSVSCGPNAVLALAREHYGRFACVPRDVLDSLMFRGTWQLVRRYWKEGGREVVRDFSKKLFVADAKRYLPAIETADLVERHCGIRAQAVKNDGSLVDDFSFVSSAGVVHVRNAPSPAATACFEIADHIVESLPQHS